MRNNLPNCGKCNKRLSRKDAKFCNSCRPRNGRNNPNFRGGKITVCCYECGKRKKIKRKELKFKYHFCNRKCLGTYRSKNYIAENNPFFGRVHTKKVRVILSLNHGGTGQPYENNKYPEEFYKIRQYIRKRDNYTCQNCLMTEEEHLIVYGQILNVHHIDYNKNNCKESNLLTSCKPCNTRFNFNRDYWKKILTQKIKV